MARSASRDDDVESVLGGGNSSGRATRELLVVTAERLFAERGIAAVSLREVGQAAHQRNNGATQYHFGDRDGLIRAILVYRASAHQERRHELLSGIPRPVGRHHTRAIVEAYLDPVVTEVRRGNHYVGFVSRLLAERARLPPGSGSIRSGYTLVAETLRQCVPELPEPVFESRMWLNLVWATHALADWQLNGDRHTVDLDAFVDDVVAQLTAALLAPHAGC